MSNPRETAIEFFHVHYRISVDRSLISDLTFSVKRGETLMLIGRSGSGKTTSLKLINRLLAPTEGTVHVDGLDNAKWDTIHLRRHIGYAIQDVGLFPHYTVEQNVALVPKLESWEKTRIEIRVREVLNLVGLTPETFAKRYPHQLSGGQKQRVGLARALAADPPILLMDEPFGALDPITRSEIREQFRELQQRLGKTVVFVTHDVSEALILGNHIALLNSGALEGIYKPEEFLASEDAGVKPYAEAFRTVQRALVSSSGFRETSN